MGIFDDFVTSEFRVNNKYNFKKTTNNIDGVLRKTLFYREWTMDDGYFADSWSHGWAGPHFM